MAAHSLCHIVAQSVASVPSADAIGWSVTSFVHIVPRQIFRA